MFYYSNREVQKNGNVSQNCSMTSGTIQTVGAIDVHEVVVVPHVVGIVRNIRINNVKIGNPF